MPLVEVVVPTDQLNFDSLCTNCVDSYLDTQSAILEFIRDVYLPVKWVGAWRPSVVDPAVDHVISFDRAYLVPAQGYLFGVGLIPQRGVYFHVFVLLGVPPALEGADGVNSAC